MLKGRILIIDDDVDICTLLKRYLERQDYNVITAFKGADGVKLALEEEVDLVLTDFRLPDKNGFDILKEIKYKKRNLPIIVITGYSDVNQAVKSIRLGAFEYVTKPIYPEEILSKIEEALKSTTENEAQDSNFSDRKTTNNSPSQHKKITSTVAVNNNQSEILQGNSAKSKNIQKLIELVAPTDMTVVIIGESGTGKEIVARMIHTASNRNEKPFVAVDCGALPQDLAASELFGHVKGAFTGATNDKKGHFEMADTGTLFLDEIGNLSYDNQVKLLRVLQERVFRRMGSEKDIPVDVRIIVATNEDLKKAMKSGKFREDIYYRINEFKIALPSLKENPDDLEDLIHFFIQKSNKELNKSVERIDFNVKSIFEKYAWPGNIRELKNVIKRAVLLTDGKLINEDVIPMEIRQPNANNEEDKLLSTLVLKDVVERAESQAILKALELTQNNKSKSAELLGVDRKTLYNKMNAYGLLEK
jgi:two-component system response regulator HydG